MLQLLSTQQFSSVGKPATLRSAIGSFLVHTVAVLTVLGWAYYGPAAGTLPVQLTQVTLLAPAPPLPPPPLPPATEKAIRTSMIRPARVFSPVVQAPAAIPAHAAIIAEVAELPPDIGSAAGVPGGVVGGIPGGVLGGIPGGVAEPLPPPPPPALPPVRTKPAAPAQPSRIQVDSGVQEAKLLVSPQPEYPVMARQAHIEGTVRLTAVIDRDGNVTELKVTKGNPLLAGAACLAVEKWRYRPTYLHDQAVEVATEIIVVFHLSRAGP